MYAGYAARITCMTHVHTYTYVYYVHICAGSTGHAHLYLRTCTCACHDVSTYVYYACRTLRSIQKLCKQQQSLNTPRWIRIAEATTSHPSMAILSNLATSKAQHLSSAIRRHKTTRRKATSTRLTKRNLLHIVITEVGYYRPITMDRGVRYTAIPLDTVRQPR